MKAAIAYKVIYFLKVYIFKDLLILNALYQKYIANVTFKLFSKFVFQFGFKKLLKNGQKNKKKMIHFCGKKEMKNQNCYHNDICRWKLDSFPIELFE